ncbi:ATP-dependent DNA helicase PcrA [Kibdelosporangium sp. 4NS15]|uniref:DNA 3'-5' helicase n=1 Tax=Kibdelosporangium persicum TaxID=2698649 RepID=A0ABX2FID4_9PSEU|nr:ATP-dependent DNA helicase PcrA [Kibdelosporangium persicum]
MIAGPGAGKTEFLAQRAAYLLQTGMCPSPRRILAISFKRDAAANLGRRVQTRVPEHAERFVSMTFDAFTKGLVDKFKSSLPRDWRRSNSYELVFPSGREQRDFVNYLASVTPTALRPALDTLPRDTFSADVVGAWALPFALPDREPASASAFAALTWWQERYLQTGTPHVDFVMLNRLAELLVRAVPHLRRALQITYPFVFVDEFQDTTLAQFSFLKSIFGNGTAVTAVGDRKQRIMGFAGALPNAFAQFIRDFDATPYPLSWNFRSSQGLVDLQHVIASRLDPTTIQVISRTTAEHGHEPVSLWTFTGVAREADCIAKWIADDLAQSQRTPADFALVARQKVADFEARFRARLAEHNIRLRNDDAMVGKMRLQDLLKNDVARLLLGMLRLAAQPSGLGSVWLEASRTMERIHGAAGDDYAVRRVNDELTQTIRSLHKWLNQHPVDSTSTSDVIARGLELVDVENLRRHARAAARGEDVDVVFDAFDARLAQVAAHASDWAAAFDDFESANAVSLLTVHRSKSLEYHTVFFLGLDDDQWWAHDRDVDGSTSTFFVGLSRAAQRLIFTSTSAFARRGKIADLYAMLDEAGVRERRWI